MGRWLSCLKTTQLSCSTLGACSSLWEFWFQLLILSGALLVICPSKTPVVQTVIELPQLRAAQVRVDNVLSKITHVSLFLGEDLWSLSCWSWPQRGVCDAAWRRRKFGDRGDFETMFNCCIVHSNIRKPLKKNSQVWRRQFASNSFPPVNLTSLALSYPYLYIGKSYS